MKFTNIFLLTFLVFSMVLSAPIKPLPQSVKVDRKKVVLGHKLFFDPRLSQDGTVSCASCHDLENGGDDGRKFSIGVGGKRGNINSPTVYNAVFNFRQFWDGRAEDLKAQVFGPIENPVEMNMTMAQTVDTLKKDPMYVSEFAKVYSDGITQENVADAIAEYEKTLITPNAPFDRYLKGEKNAISPEVEEGYKLFESKGCIVCHNGINVGGNFYNKFGIFKDANSSALGRYNITKREEDKYVFKVPSLRNVALTAPYMHDGRAHTLKEAVEIMSEHQLGRYMTEDEIMKIVAFLKSLTGEIPQSVKKRN
ncbi:cytochrome-c peroxidase [Sulfurovum sp. NBC37-1]|uniref:cytochrome-c peroxidase n=1 Tax=Sulfurovum sp. (strain NBC37-1) TaxID=387093 RepID=UPI0001587C8B|nr:cytochrome-c peroxidase [Sulfurovum sp. NBC37-1]BAF72577.1 cytochrome c peroxidase [Sulfurovum sp. NBC37-1]